MNPMPCLFVGAPWGDTFANVDLPLREVENLHGLEFRKTHLYGYTWTGRRTQYAPPKRTFKSRAEMTGKKPTRAVDVD